MSRSPDQSQARRSKTRTIQVIVGHPYARVGLELILEQAGYKLVTGPLEELDGANLPAGDLTIVGTTLDREHGRQVLKRLRKAAPDHPVLLLVSPDARTDGEEAIENGANGYLLLNQSRSEVTAACQHLLAGQIYRPPSPNAHTTPESG